MLFPILHSILQFSFFSIFPQFWEKKVQWNKKPTDVQWEFDLNQIQLTLLLQSTYVDHHYTLKCTGIQHASIEFISLKY